MYNINKPIFNSQMIAYTLYTDFAILPPFNETVDSAYSNSDTPKGSVPYYYYHYYHICKNLNNRCSVVYIFFTLFTFIGSLSHHISHLLTLVLFENLTVL